MSFCSCRCQKPRNKPTSKNGTTPHLSVCQHWNIIGIYIAGWRTTYKQKPTSNNEQQPTIDDSKSEQNDHKDEGLVFRQVSSRNGTPSRYCFHKGCRLIFNRKQKDGSHKYICTHMSSVPEAHCPAVLIVHYDEEEKKCDPSDQQYTSFTYKVEHNGTFEENGHERFDEGDIAVIDFIEDFKHRIDKGSQVHDAYHQSSQDHPQVAENLIMGFESLRNIGYRHASEDGTAMPFDPALIGKYLEDRHLNGNLYDQILDRKLYDEATTTPEQLREWDSRRGTFYLGDDGTNGKRQHWCPRWGAVELSTGFRIYIDVSYKSTPSIARLQKPWGGVLHILAGRKNERNEWVPHTTPCATILLEKAKPDGMDYIEAFKSLHKLCKSHYKIDIINDTARTEVITMGDMEEALRQAVGQFWRKSKKKICAFHYAQALLKKMKDRDIGLFKDYNKNLRVHWYFRNFFVLWAVPPRLLYRCFKVLIKKRGDPQFGYTDVCEEAGKKWIDYWSARYMKDKVFAKEWNHWYSFVRTNNELESRNGRINLMFGNHPYINKYAFRLAKWYQQEYVQLQQYKVQGYQRRRKSTEVLKNNLLKQCWDWLDSLGNKPTDDQLVTFLKYCNVAVTGKRKKLEEILGRKLFWVSET